MLPIQGLALVPLVVCAALLGCSSQEPADHGPRALTPEELSRLEIDGAVSKWLPIRFSAEILNTHESLTITHVQLVVHGREIERAARIAPGETRRIAVQYLFPEDPDFGSIDPASVEWKLVGATGSAAPPG